MRSFYILNKRVSSPGSRSPDPNQFPDSIDPVVHSALEYRRGFRDRIRYRDMVWAFHSNSQEILLAASTSACGGKVIWKDARAMGVFLWLNSIESLVRPVHRNRVVSLLITDHRNPKWRRSLETNICSAKNEIPRNAACSTSHWARFGLFKACGDRHLGTPNPTSCSNFCPTTLIKIDGGLLHSRTRSLCLANGEMVCFTGVLNQGSP